MLEKHTTLLRKRSYIIQHSQFGGGIQSQWE